MPLNAADTHMRAATPPHIHMNNYLTEPTFHRLHPILPHRTTPHDRPWLAGTPSPPAVAPPQAPQAPLGAAVLSGGGDSDEDVPQSRTTAVGADPLPASASADGSEGMRIAVPPPHTATGQTQGARASRARRRWGWRRCWGWESWQEHFGLCLPFSRPGTLVVLFLDVWQQ